MTRKNKAVLRAGDIDDVITNALGGVIGCALAKMVSSVFRKKGRGTYEKQGE
ncbi:MAG: VanZ family protein [Oscillospiraceae bacterium]|nr:VanZ family protein [Oscillospiraceae bacterium]